MPALLRYVGEAPARAVGTNLMVGLCVGVAGVLGHAPSGIDWGLLAVGSAVAPRAIVTDGSRLGNSSAPHNADTALPPPPSLNVQEAPCAQQPAASHSPLARRPGAGLCPGAAGGRARGPRRLARRHARGRAASGDQLPPGQPINGRTAPFAGQPVQGFSAVLPAGDGRYLAMPDNGFGARDNSADFLLRVYRVKPRFETASGGVGTIEIGTSSSCAIPTARSAFRSSTTPWASAC